jgi:DNA-binding transcriptional ArsR family regulator
MDTSSNKRMSLIGVLFSVILLAVLYFFIEPPLWLFVVVTVFIIIIHIEQTFETHGLFGAAAGLLLVGGGLAGIALNEAVIISTLAIILGVIATYRGISELRATPPATVSFESEYSEEYLQLIITQKVFAELDRKPQTPSELMVSLDLTKPRITAALNELEKRGIIRTRQDSNAYEPTPITRSVVGRTRLRLRLFGSWLRNPNKNT